MMKRNIPGGHNFEQCTWLFCFVFVFSILPRMRDGQRYESMLILSQGLTICLLDAQGLGRNMTGFGEKEFWRRSMWTDL